ncbi:DinB family protein [Streptacidiphilus monticola]|uniref:DinB family protein n=1 Tax=Streptacidiphilus monticola TaxID=2161674 RepID=A0ABW1G0P7_9ACTN
MTRTPVRTGELQGLLDALAGQRAHVLRSLEGLGEAELRRGVLPSGWSCLGLVNHLARDVERFWFRAVLGGEGEAAIAAGDAWTVDPERPAADVLDGYRRDTARADEVLARLDPDAEPAWWPDGLFGAWRLDSARQVVLHVITETACHAGHLDAVRELLDGRQDLVLTSGGGGRGGAEGEPRCG